MTQLTQAQQETAQIYEAQFRALIDHIEESAEIAKRNDPNGVHWWPDTYPAYPHLAAIDVALDRPYEWRFDKIMDEYTHELKRLGMNNRIESLKDVLDQVGTDFLLL